MLRVRHGATLMPAVGSSATVAVHPDHYLDARRPAWRAMERRGRVRGGRGLVWLHPDELGVRLELARRWPAVYMPPVVGDVLALFGGEIAEVRPAARRETRR